MERTRFLICLILLDSNVIQYNTLRNTLVRRYVHSCRFSWHLFFRILNKRSSDFPGYRDFLILIAPKIAMNMPIATTAPNSRVPLSSIALP